MQTERYEVIIDGTGSELQGVGRLPDGRAVFVPGTIPGERVLIHIDADKGRYCEASLLDVLEPSPDRVAPECPYAGQCGGCHARHMTYARTLALKRQRVYDALTRIGGFTDPEVRETLGCSQVDRTRNKAEYPIGIVDGRAVIGACARGSHQILPLRDCLLQSDQSVRALNWLSDRLDSLSCAPHLRYLVTRTNRAGEMMLILCGDIPLPRELQRLSPAPDGARSLWYCQLNRRPAHALDGRCAMLWGDPTLRERLFDLQFDISPQSFFQVNTAQAERLYQCALDAAGIRQNDGLDVLDAYCGAGAITLSAARFARRVTGVEIVAPAIENARQNARLNAISNARFICADVARELPSLLARGERFDVVLLDPPRKGADPASLQAIADARIPTVSYVSCNPATLARDLRLWAAQGYRLHWAQPVDMFPWTGHVETVALMSRDI